VKWYWKCPIVLCYWTPPKRVDAAKGDQQRRGETDYWQCQ